MGVFSGRNRLDGSPVAKRAEQGVGGGTFGMWGISSPMDLIPTRPFQKLGPTVTMDTAMRHSAVWACIRLRADLLSTLPIDAFRNVAGQQIELPRPPILAKPGGERVDIHEYMYSSQQDLDRAGNHIAIIAKLNGYGLPAQLEAQPSSEVSVVVRDGRLWKYRISGKLYDPDVIWHEKAFTASGLHVGLSPVAYAAWTIGLSMNVQEFATNWFAQMGIPRARLKNTQKTLSPVEAAVVKESWRASISAGEPFVHGADWDYAMIQAEQASADWLTAQEFSISDVARYFGVPVDLIDGLPSGARSGRGASITYANITQRNLQLMIMNLGPSIVRREAAWTRMLPVGQYVKWRTSDFLRMDPTTRAQWIWQRIQARTLAPSEARAMDNQPPLTAAQIGEFDHFWPPMGMLPGPSPEGEAPSFDQTPDTVDIQGQAAGQVNGHTHRLQLTGSW